MNNIPELISGSNNEFLKAIPEDIEIKQTAFKLNEDSTSSPDGLSGRFFQVCWDIICDDIIRLVRSIFAGNTLPKSTNTNLILIPKKDSVQSFSKLRPISLSKFINKILSRIVHARLEGILPNLISPN